MRRDPLDRPLMTGDNNVRMIVSDAAGMDDIPAFGDGGGETIRDAVALGRIESHRWILQRLLRRPSSCNVMRIVRAGPAT